MKMCVKMKELSPIAGCVLENFVFTCKSPNASGNLPHLVIYLGHLLIWLTSVIAV